MCREKGYYKAAKWQDCTQDIPFGWTHFGCFCGFVLMISNVHIGLTADARILIDRMRIECKSYRLTVEDPVTVEYIARHMAQLKQKYTQSNGRRPFGVSTLLCGVNKDGTTHLYQTDPSGTHFEWLVCQILAISIPIIGKCYREKFKSCPWILRKKLQWSRSHDGGGHHKACC